MWEENSTGACSVQTSHNSRFLRKYWIKLQNLHGFLNQHSNNLIHINIGSCQILTDPCSHAPRHTTLCWDWCNVNILARNIHMLLAGKQTSSHSAAQPSMASDAISHVKHDYSHLLFDWHIWDSEFLVTTFHKLTFSITFFFPYLHYFYYCRVWKICFCRLKLSAILYKMQK